jgi:hypothetical protein
MLRDLTQISTRNRLLAAAGLAALLALATGLSGCRVHTEKGANGEDKSVRVDTPFGGMHVNTGQTSAADLGLPAYPGSQIVPDNDNDKSADVHMGFGQWELRVRVVNYSTPDSQDKVVAFYKKALGRFGDVIACQDKAPVGTPTVTAEGLNCSDDGKANVHVDSDSKSYNYGNRGGHSGFELKAGSNRHQHVVSFESSAPGETRFSLVEIVLPAATSGDSGKSD